MERRSRPRRSGSISAEGLKELGDRLVKKGEPTESRVKTASELAAMVLVFGQSPPDPARPKLPTLRAPIVQLRPAFHDEQNAELQRAIAAAMANLHLVSHTLYTPDELARSRSTAEYRRTHPAANAAAEAIVVYPTNRPGAPGLAP